MFICWMQWHIFSSRGSQRANAVLRRSTGYSWRCWVHMWPHYTKGLHCTTARVASPSWHTMAACLPVVKLSAATQLHLPHQGARYSRPRSVINVMGMESQKSLHSSRNTGVLFKLKANLENGTSKVAGEARDKLEKEVLFIHDKRCRPYYTTTSREFPEGFF